MKLKQRTLRAIIYYGTKALISLFNLLPYTIAVWLGARLGLLVYYVLPYERKKSIKNILKAFPEMDHKWAAMQIRETFQRLGISIMELVKIETIARHIDEYITVKNMDVLEQSIKKGAGVIWITGHIGNWELMPVYFAKKGYKVYVVAKRLYDHRIDDIINDLRRNHGVQPIIRGEQGSSKAILKALRSNSLLGMLIDQDTDVQGVYVKFFGDMAFTPRGASDLAIKAGSDVIAGFITRTGKNRHIITIHGPITYKRTSDYEKDVIGLTQEMTVLIEQHIRNHPSDWVWMHSRWAKKPV